MLKYFLILLMVSLVLWKGKPYLLGLFLKYKEKKSKEVRNVSPELVYSPIESSRTFDFRIQIDEVGNGKVKMTIVK